MRSRVVRGDQGWKSLACGGRRLEVASGVGGGVTSYLTWLLERHGQLARTASPLSAFEADHERRENKSRAGPLSKPCHVFSFHGAGGGRALSGGCREALNGGNGADCLGTLCMLIEWGRRLGEHCGVKHFALPERQ